jgi:hypothetical protein
LVFVGYSTAGPPTDQLPRELTPAEEGRNAVWPILSVNAGVRKRGLRGRLLPVDHPKTLNSAAR